MTPEVGTVFWTAVVFFILLVTLTKVGWKPLMSTLADREARIKESLEKAEAINKKFDNAAKEREAQLKEAKAEAQQIILSARKSAQEIKTAVHEQAQKEADQLLERAKKEIDASRDSILKEMKQMAVELSMAATQKLIEKNIDEHEHQTLIQESITNLEKMN